MTTGKTLRDSFAESALVALIPWAIDNTAVTRAGLASEAYMYADAMMMERDRRRKIRKDENECPSRNE